MAGKSKGPWLRKGRGWWVWFNGKQQYLAPNKTAAWRAWHLLQAGEPIHEGDTAFRNVADAYVTYLKRSRSERHARDARYRLDQFVQPWWNRDAKSLRWPDVENVLATKEWNATTQAGHLIALRGCLRWAEKTRLLEPNPIPHISIPRYTTRQNALTAKQVAELLKHAGPLEPILWALSVTGARPGELIGATVDQCDRDGTAVRLKESKVGRRVVWFPPRCRKRIAGFRRERDSGPLFPDPDGGRWRQTRFNKEFRAARTAAKLPTWATPYSLRHTWITERLRGKKKMTMDDVARLAGTSVSMIARTYSHLSDDDIKEIADRL